MDPRKGFREKRVASDAAFPQMQLLLGLAGFQVQVHNVFEGSQPLRKPQRRMRCMEDLGRTHVKGSLVLGGWKEAATLGANSVFCAPGHLLSSWLGVTEPNNL